jgi:hypothetical protein
MPSPLPWAHDAHKKPTKLALTEQLYAPCRPLVEYAFRLYGGVERTERGVHVHERFA